MQVLFYFAVLAACVVASTAAPATPTIIDWKAARDKFNATIELVFFVNNQIDAIIGDDNLGVGERIENKTAEVSGTALPLMFRVAAAIEHETLTVHNAETFYMALKKMFSFDLKDELAQLPATKAGHIRDILNDAYAQAKQQEQELIGLLRQ